MSFGVHGGYSYRFGIYRLKNEEHLLGDWDTEEEASEYLRKHHAYFSNGLERRLGKVCVSSVWKQRSSDDVFGYVIAITKHHENPCVNTEDVRYLEDIKYGGCGPDDEFTRRLIFSDKNHMRNAHVFLNLNEAIHIVSLIEPRFEIFTRIILRVPIGESWSGNDLCIRTPIESGRHVVTPEDIIVHVRPTIERNG